MSDNWAHRKDSQKKKKKILDKIVICPQMKTFG